MAALRSWFLRDVLEAVARTNRGSSQERLQERVPERLHAHIDRIQLAQAGPRDTLPLDDAEEVLLALDVALGDGSGRVLSDAAADIASRLLTRGSTHTSATDLAGTFDRVRMPMLELPFIDAGVNVAVNPTDTGFDVSVSVPGRPRCARVHRHLCTGTIWSCKSFCRDAPELQVLGETYGDRVIVTARYARASIAPDPIPSRPPIKRRRSSSMRAITGTGLQDEVERILGNTTHPPARPTSSTPPVPASEFPAPSDTPKKPRS